MRDPDTIRRVSELEDQMRRLTDLIRIEALPPLRLQRDYGTGLSLAIDATALQAGNVLFIRVYANDGGSPPAYAWHEQYQLTPGVWIDNPLGANGSTTNQPAYVDDGATVLPALPSGSLCRAVLHSGGVYWDAWPVLVPPTYLGIALSGMTGISGTTYGKGTVNLLTTFDNGDGTFDEVETGFTVTALNPCSSMPSNSLVELFREPLRNQLIAQLLCAGEPPPCPCENDCLMATFPGWSFSLTTAPPFGRHCLDPFSCTSFVAGSDPDSGVFLTFVSDCVWTGQIRCSSGGPSGSGGLLAIVDARYDGFYNVWSIVISENAECCGDPSDLCGEIGCSGQTYAIQNSDTSPCDGQIILKCNNDFGACPGEDCVDITPFTGGPYATLGPCPGGSGSGSGGGAPTIDQNFADICSTATSLTITGTHFTSPANSNTVTLTDSGLAIVANSAASGTSTSLTLTLTSPPIVNLGALKATVTNFNGSSGIAVQVATVLDGTNPSTFTSNGTFTACTTAPHLFRLWGHGGNGAASSGAANINGGGGGGGGSYVEITLSLTAGDTVDLAGGHGVPTTAISSAVTVGSADYGRDASTITGGAGGLIANCVGTVKRAGGTGGNAPGGLSGGGGGGEAGGNGGNGNNGSNGVVNPPGTGGAGGNGAGDGGDGGNGGTYLGVGASGVAPGGGGGGASSRESSGQGLGGDWKVVVSW